MGRIGEMHYLTVQDMLFLNLRITGSKQPFDTLNLEEAVYCQYGSGQSSDLVAQGARFLTGFAKMAPFKAGNEACAFAGLVAFLEANGKALDVKDIGAEAWVRPLFSDRAAAADAIGKRLKEAHQPVSYGVPDLQEIAEDVLARFPHTLSQLVESSAQAS